MKFKGITIFQNKNCKTWYTRYRLNGKQFYISASTQKKCYNLLKEKLNIPEKIKKNENTLKMWYEKWIKLFKVGKVKEITINSYKYLLKNFSENFLNTKIKRITSLEIQNELTKIVGDRQKQKSYEFLNDVLNKAQKFGIIEKNPISIIEKPKYKSKSGYALTKTEQEIFIKECKNQKEFGKLFLVTLFQGLRKGEALAITYNDIDLKKKTLTINKSWNRNNKFDTTKNENSVRIMPIFQNTYEILKEYSTKSDKRIFEYSIRQCDQHFKKIIKICKFGEHIRMHDLRHTFITNCKDINIPEHIVQHFVGHAIGSKVTSKIYTHINEENLQENIDKINKKLNSNSTQKKEN
jgi:integrase